MTLFDKIELRSREEVYDAILHTYQKKWYCSISFLYFANLMKGMLLEWTPKLRQKNYLEALLNADFLLADGIALQLFWRWSRIGRRMKRTPPNLNGTDFIPRFFQKLLPTTHTIHVSLLMFWDQNIWKSEEYINKAQQVFIEKYWRWFDYRWQTNYSNKNSLSFDRNAYEKTLSKTDTHRILFVCLWTPTQEIRVHAHHDKIKQYQCLVFNAWGTIDYMTWLEQRAPWRVVKARVLETPRRIITHPKKNLKKFWAMFGIVRYWKHTIRKRFSKK